MNPHFCDKHQTKYYKNEKELNGQVKVWYSHKKLDGTGFCVRQNNEVTTQTITPKKRDELVNIHSRSIFACIAMNNAVALAANGKIPVDQIPNQFRKILTDLVKNEQ